MQTADEVETLSPCIITQSRCCHSSFDLYETYGHFQRL